MTTPPNYYVGVYNVGQPFVQVGEKQYGAYDGTEYGKAKTDAIVLQPRQMEAAIRGLLNEYLGQYDNGAAAEAAASTTTTNNNKSSKKSCSSAADCAGLLDDVCPGSGATCTGAGHCVCQRAHYHVALDEGLRPAVNEPPGFFTPNDENQNYNAGTTPVYTEPFWSSAVGVRVYRQSGPWPGIITLIAGGVVASASFFGAVVLKMGLKKEKLF
jgi:nicastrin